MMPTSSSSDLKMVAIVFRNGDRTALSTYPKDEHKDFIYNGMGFGALTRRGIRQMYVLGCHMREIYKPLFAKEGTYRRYNMAIKSSASERAVMSAYSFMAGFYPPPAEDETLPINWQPVPIYTIPKKHDDLLYARNCERYEKMYDELLKNPPEDLQTMMARDKEMLDSFKMNTGIENLDLSEIVKLYDIFKTQSSWNVPSPSWFKPECWSRYNYYYERYFQLLTETEEMKIIKAGPLLTDIFGRVVKFLKVKANQRILIYSGHKTTLSSISRALQFDSQISNIFEYGAALAFEIYKTSGEIELRIKYHPNPFSTQPINIQIPNCPKPYLLKTVLDKNKHLIVDDADQICNF